MSLLSFLQIDRDGSVNVSKLGVAAACHGRRRRLRRHHRARAKRIVFSGYFTAGAQLAIEDGALSIAKEGKVRKLVDAVEQSRSPARRAVAQGQDITYVTERCVMRLSARASRSPEIAPGVDLERDVLAQAEFPLRVANDSATMDAGAVPAGAHRARAVARRAEAVHMSRFVETRASMARSRD